MALTNFIDKVTLITAAWLNKVDQIVNALTGNVNGNLTLSPPLSGVALTIQKSSASDTIVVQAAGVNAGDVNILVSTTVSGDAYYRATAFGVQNWSWGIRRSDGAWILAESPDLSSPVLEVTTAGQVLLPIADSAAAPAISYPGDTGTGLWHPGAGRVNVTKSGSDYGDVAAILLAMKPASTSRSNTITLAADPDLVISVPAAGKYIFEAYLNFITGSAAPGIVFAFSPLGMTMSSLYGFTGNINGAPADTITNTGNNTLALNNVVNVNTVSTTTNGDNIHCNGYLISGGAGILQLVWAQRSLNASISQVNIGSWIKLTRVS